MPNRINWFTIPVLDLDRAAAFYRTVLACDVWMQKDDGFGVFSWHTGEVSGGIELGHPCTCDRGVRILLNCEGRLDEAVEAVRAGGGSIKDMCSLGNYGLQAIVVDTEGNTVHLHSFTHAGAEKVEDRVKAAAAVAETLRTERNVRVPPAITGVTGGGA